MPLSVFTIESIALILVIAKDSGTIARKTGSPCVQFISREISQATSSLTFSTRNSILETRSSRLDTRNYRGSRIESRGSRIKARGTVNLLLSGTVVYANLQHGVQMFSQISHIPDLIRKFGAKKCGLYASVYGSHVFILFCRRLIGIFFYCWSSTFVNLVAPKGAVFWFR